MQVIWCIHRLKGDPMTTQLVIVGRPGDCKNLSSCSAGSDPDHAQPNKDHLTAIHESMWSGLFRSEAAICPTKISAEWWLLVPHHKPPIRMQQKPLKAVGNPLQTKATAQHTWHPSWPAGLASGLTRHQVRPNGFINGWWPCGWSLDMWNALQS